MSKRNNKNKSVILSICILGIGLVIGAFLTLENRISQLNIIKSVNAGPEAVVYEGKITERYSGTEECIKIGSGGSIERLE